MFNKWLKPFLPQSLFGRAFLILIVPIVLIQVVVGVVFVERLFQDVTRQMTRSVSIDLNHLIAIIKDGGNPLPTANSLQINTSWIENPDLTQADKLREVYDFAGRYVIETLHNAVPEVFRVDLATKRDAAIVLTEVQGKWVEFRISRQRVSAINPHQLLVYMILASVLLSMLSALFLHNQISPIRRLSRAADAFGKGQSFPISPRGASEVRSAAFAFLSMRTRIEHQREQRTLMLSGVSHDLRTPLTRLRLSVSLLEQQDETTLMIRDINEMEEILDEFLVFGRSDTEQQVEMISPHLLAKQLVENATRDGREVSLLFEGAQNAHEPIRMRRLAVHRAISNLISNALRYGDKTSILVNTCDEFVEFVVEDNGPGIRSDQREDAVEPFTRLDVARNQDKGSGVGLGLAIAADIARSHGGSLLLSDSKTLGGLQAAFRLPR